MHGRLIERRRQPGARPRPKTAGQARCRTGLRSRQSAGLVDDESPDFRQHLQSRTSLDQHADTMDNGKVTIATVRPAITSAPPGFFARDRVLARILLTGGTGLIGGAVLHNALQSGASDAWVCLVRAPDDSTGRERLTSRLARFTDRRTARMLTDRVEVITGDFTSADESNDPRLNAVTHVLHLAADTSWWGQDKVHRTNHDGTLSLARRACRMPKLERFLHVSTAMICGSNSPRLVQEEMYPSSGAVHLVSYSESKAEAEASLARQFPQLPIIVARPSVVVGHSVLGARPSASILWVFRAADRLRLVSCDLDGSVDVVPSDWTAEILLGLLRKPNLAHRVYHVSAGMARRSRWKALARAFEQADPAGGERVYERLPVGDKRLLQARFEEEFGFGDAVQLAMFRAMQAYYRFCELNVTFSNERLLAEGFRSSPSLPDYLFTCLRNCECPEIIDQFTDDMEMFVQDPGQGRRRSRRIAPSDERAPMLLTA